MVAEVKQGLATADNDRFLRLWHEVNFNNIDLKCRNINNFNNKKWAPLSKGGEFKKWFGNNDYIINWEKNGEE